LEPLRHSGGVLHVPLHTEAQRLEPLEEEEGIERSDRRTRVAQVLQASLEDEPGGKEGRGQIAKDEAVIAGVRLGKGGESPAALVVERAAVDDDAPDGGAVAADELGGGVDDDVGAVTQGLSQVRRGQRAVDTS